MFHLIIMTTSSILSIIFTQMNHPLAMGLMLLAQTPVICLMTWFMTQSFWFSYILFLVFLGGLLLLFIYVTSLASNEMFTLSTTTAMMTITPMFMMTIIILFMDPLPWLTSMMNNDMFNMMSFNYYHEESTNSLMSLYNQPTGLITLILVLYLFLTLIAVVKITSIFYGPLRQKN